jgi:hypothetical protein
MNTNLKHTIMKKTLLLIMAMAIGPFVFAQDCSDLFISEYVEGSGNNKAIEIYNPTDEAIDLGQYQLVRYSNGGFTPYSVDIPADIIGPNSTYVIALDKRDPDGSGYETPIDSALMEVADTFLCPVWEVNRMMYFNGNDAVTLEKNNGQIILDIVARVGYPDPDYGWTDITDTTVTWDNNGVPEEYTIYDYMVGPIWWLSWTLNNTLIRKHTVKEGIHENPDVFIVDMEWDSLPNNTFENLGFHNCDCHLTGNADKFLNAKVDIFPNPVTNEKMTIVSSGTITHLELLNTFGQTIRKEDMAPGTKKYTMELGPVRSGVCFIKLSFENKNTLVMKIVVR